ncbi:serine hydrolase [Candidatus Micrarchaeota archaeon]|nr:serine hydrolase [Candidatus Micrarchaeota archaeon]
MKFQLALHQRRAANKDKYEQQRSQCMGLTRREFLGTFLGLGASLLARRSKAAAYLTDTDKAVHEHIADLRTRRILQPSDKTSIYVYGLHSDQRFVRINIDEQRMAASLIKPFVMLAAYHALFRGKKAPPSLESDIRAMISQSDNNATNRVMRFAGGPSAVHRIAQRYGFNSTKVVEYIPPGGRTYRNKTTARNLNAFLWMCHNNKLVSPHYSHRMLQHFDNYSTSRIARTGENVELAGKTGFVGGLNGEMARVTYPSSSGPRHYSFIAIIENKAMRRASAAAKNAWGKRTSNAIRSIFKITHSHMTR